ncbi:MAG: protein kinase [Candidatus Obscuribacter sp.]|nr:protein kinase [Candidatus Obscuribacter sp.]
MIDFGIAKSIYGEVQGAAAITSHGVIVGSPQYICPEQLLGQEITPASDLYSLGCVYYQMLAGHPPFTLVNPVLLVLQHINDEPDLDCIPKAKRSEISTLLQKDPKNRITTPAPPKEAGFNALDFIKKDRFLLALSSAFIQLPVWINLLIASNLGPATLLLLVLFASDASHAPVATTK